MAGDQSGARQNVGAVGGVDGGSKSCCREDGRAPVQGKHLARSRQARASARATFKVASLGLPVKIVYTHAAVESRTMNVQQANMNKAKRASLEPMRDLESSPLAFVFVRDTYCVF